MSATPWMVSQITLSTFTVNLSYLLSNTFCISQWHSQEGSDIWEGLSLSAFGGRSDTVKSQLNSRQKGSFEIPSHRTDPGSDGLRQTYKSRSGTASTNYRPGRKLHRFVERLYFTNRTRPYESFRYQPCDNLSGTRCLTWANVRNP